MDKAELIQVIRTTLLRRGNGKDDPVRIIEQFWSVDGKLIAENDPMPNEHVTFFEAREPMERA